MPGAAVAKYPTPAPAEPRPVIPVLTDEELARVIVQNLSSFLPDAENHRAEARRVVEHVLEQWRNFGTRGTV